MLCWRVRYVLIGVVFHFLKYIITYLLGQGAKSEFGKIITLAKKLYKFFTLANFMSSWMRWTIGISHGGEQKSTA